MPHVVLLGDSIFDNERYVPDGPSVIQHLRRVLPAGWRGTLRAVDGSIAAGVAEQLTGLPADATHLVVSTGGNNALELGAVMLNDAPGSYYEVLSQLGAAREEFLEEYRTMLRGVLACGLPTVLCTIYDSIPDLRAPERAGLSVFNEVILREAARAGVPVLDLRLLCHEASDYAESSPIEPSMSGGGKIARAVTKIVTGHDFATGGCRVFAG